MATSRPLHCIAAILLLALPASAQFDALPDSNAAWTETFWIGPGYPYEGFFHTYDTTSPDTVYNGNVYQKLLTTYSNNFIIWGTGYGGALRDNGLGQVYYWAPGEPDPVLLYDFDVQVGDTVEDVYSIWTQDVRVYSVDQTIVNGTQRKRIGLECLDQPGFIGAYWIQGIGGIGGLFRTTACPSVSGIGALVCMTVNDTILWGANVGAVGDCSLLLGQSDLDVAEESLVIYPNPATDRLSITRDGIGSADVEVIGPDGRLVLAMLLSGSELSLSTIPPGAYVLKAREASGEVRMARFVKH
jgi:hypothetical protein